MKLLCLINFFIFIQTVNPQSIAFYYGKDFSLPYIQIFDLVVVQPQNLPREILVQNPKKYYAYISISEFEDEKIKNFAVLYRNDWNSFIADIRNPLWQDYLLQKIKKLKEQGFINFFFDNIDSYKLIMKNQNEEKDFINAIIKFLDKFKTEHPESDLILNRPLDILNEAIKYSSKIVVESLFHGIDTKNKKYIKIPKEETDYLLEILNKAKKIGYKVYVVDYEKDKKQRLNIARIIKEYGFEPYVSDYMLEEWGTNEFEYIPRDIILIYDSNLYSDKIFSQAHRIFSLPIEYLGYRPKIIDINDGLPKINERIHGFIFTDIRTQINPKKLKKWIEDVIKNNIKLIFLGSSMFINNPDILDMLKIRKEENKDISKNEPFKILKIGKCATFEIDPGYINTKEMLIPTNAKEIISYMNQLNQKHIPAAFTSWGGYIMSEVLIKKIFDKEALVINPFCFFENIFRKIPSPDITTENGNRILFTHIDGDGFSSLYENSPQRKYSSEILLEEILEKLKVPHSISVIRGEVENHNLKDNEKEKLRKIAKKIFELPYVEPANHSYSHPFRWIELKDIDEYEHVEQVYNIDIPNYKFNIYEEIINTNKWIEEYLSENKKVKLFFWTGDCIAPYTALKLLNENNLLNINGGYTTATYEKPFISYIGPHGIERNGLYQIYAAQMNENVYTNLWNGPYWGFEKVLETQEITDKPLRLKPINIYYHFYSASKYESLNTLKKIYETSLKKEVILKYTSDYIKTVLDFYNLEIFNYQKKWIIVSNGYIKTIRTKDIIKIDDAVCGYKKINDSLYYHLCSRPPYKLEINDSETFKPYLEFSNAEIEYFKKNNNIYNIKLKGYLPIKYKFINTKKIKEKEYKEGVYYVKEIELQ